MKRLLILIIAGVAFIGIGLLVKKKSKPHKPLSKIEHTIKHLALIMDGNRRWAKSAGLKAWDGHKKGVEPVKLAVEFCLEQHIPYLSLYAFSLENFKRSPEELSMMFGIIKNGLSGEEIEKLVKNGVRIRFIGDRTRFPKDLQESIDHIESTTAHGTALSVQILFCYGGRQELTAAVQELARMVAAGKLTPDQITESSIEEHMWTGNIPDPDLVIRTGKEKRMSNFMPWKSAYSELMFMDIYWPEITKQHLHDAVTAFTSHKRNFGK